VYFIILTDILYRRCKKIVQIYFFQNLGSDVARVAGFLQKQNLFILIKLVTMFNNFNILHKNRLSKPILWTKTKKNVKIRFFW